MVRLNKNELNSEQLNKLYVELARVLSPSDHRHALHVTKELLGYEERVMVAKRIAAIVLLLEGFSKYRVSRHLKLSESTVAVLRNKIQNDSFTTILNTLGKSKKNYFSILEVLDSVLHLGGVLPHYNGLDRYKNIR